MGSLVGNVGIANIDRSLQHTGPGSPNIARKQSQIEAEEAEESYFEEHESEKQDHGIPAPAGSSGSASGSGDSDEEVKRLARQYTKNSTYSNVEGNPFAAEEGSVIDPSSDNFRARAWVQSMLKLHSQESEHKTMGRQAGVCFRNLSAHGYGSAADYQKSVGNVPLELWGLAKRLMGAKQRRIDILRNLDGLVHAGEMLVVLGPPGSGCSTFLKTITGAVSYTHLTLPTKRIV